MKKWALEMIERLVARGEVLCAMVVAMDYGISVDKVEKLVAKYK